MVTGEIGQLGTLAVSHARVVPKQELASATILLLLMVELIALAVPLSLRLVIHSPVPLQVLFLLFNGQ